MRYEAYEMAFHCLPVSVLGHDGSLITRPLRSGYDDIILVGTWLVIVVNIYVNNLPLFDDDKRFMYLKNDCTNCSP